MCVNSSHQRSMYVLIMFPLKLKNRSQIPANPKGILLLSELHNEGISHMVWHFCYYSTKLSC